MPELPIDPKVRFKLKWAATYETTRDPAMRAAAAMIVLADGDLEQAHTKACELIPWFEEQGHARPHIKMYEEARDILRDELTVLGAAERILALSLSL